MYSGACKAKSLQSMRIFMIQAIWRRWRKKRQESCRARLGLLSYRLRNILANPREYLGHCWVVFRSRNYADAKRKVLVCTILGFFLIPLVGMGFEHWEVGFGKKVGWEMGLVPALQDPLSCTGSISCTTEIRCDIFYQ